MVLASFLVAALCHITSVNAGLSERNAALKDRMKPETFGRIQKRQFEQAAMIDQGQPSRPVTTHYLTEKTKKYLVDGSKLPDVDFNIGETYAGLLPIDDTKELFFWFVPSLNPAAKDEITLWLNGGPGCSSLDGFLHEQGPVIWQAGTYAPVPNTWAWNNLTNMVFVEQPVGTGFTQGTPNITNEVELAAQFLPFWKNFMDLFDLCDRKVYITGESYAGQYCPYIADAMIEQNDTKYFNVNGMLIYDPAGVYEVAIQAATMPFVNAHLADFPFNQTWRAALVNASQTCGYDDYLNEGLQFPPKGPFNNPPARNYSAEQGYYGQSTDECDVFDAVFGEMFFINPCFDLYQVGQICPLLFDVLGFPYSGPYFPVGYTQGPYFNRSDVREVIHAPPQGEWSVCADKPVFGGKEQRELSPPSLIRGGPLMRVIEATSNVIVGHADLDMVLIANGTLLTLNNLTWNGKQGFSKPPVEPFFVPYHEDPIMGSQAGSGVFGGYVTERGLTFVAIVLSGHEVPEYQPSAAYRHLEFLLGRIDSLKDTRSFTTQNVPQNLTEDDLGPGTWWPSVETGLGY